MLGEGLRCGVDDMSLKACSLLLEVGAGEVEAGGLVLVTILDMSLLARVVAVEGEAEGGNVVGREHCVHLDNHATIRRALFHTPRRAELLLLNGGLLERRGGVSI